LGKRRSKKSPNKPRVEIMKILVVEDEPSIRLGISCTLEEAGHQVATSDDGIEGSKLFAKKDFDVVITDLRLPGIDGIEVLKSVKAISPETGVIVITAFADVKTAVEAMKEGAYDYISKPFDPTELLIVVDRLKTYKGLKLENIRLREEIGTKGPFQQIVGQSPQMQRIFETISIVAKSYSSVIIYGESGSGKELVANAIHNLSPRNDKPFIKINCAAIPEQLLESELFGYEKGAFTGATQRKKGKFEAADTGTIFFDEIGEMPASLQAKLLRVLEYKAFERLGGNEKLTVDVNTIFATAKKLLEEVKKGTFREDLYYRLNVLPVTIPPLRERREDIILLINHFIKMFSIKVGRSIDELSPDAKDLLLSYDYPGNARELKSAIEMAVTFCKGNRINTECLPVEIRMAEKKQNEFPINSESLVLAESLKVYEKKIIIKALENTGYKKAEAAKKLGISRETLWRKLKEYDLPLPCDPPV
jgi:DNA-binding NtrC family response regulator